MFSAFFVSRPKFAFVISIVITLIGLIVLPSVPVAEFPQISPPQVSVSASYPGAEAGVVETTIAIPVEEQVAGVDGLTEISSTSSNGGYSLTANFELGIDPDIAAVNVQNRVASATTRLPEEVVQNGIVTAKRSSSIVLAVNLLSPNGSHDALFLGNYALLTVRDALNQLPGVGGVSLIGDLKYGMRVWLDPDRMASLGLTPEDVTAAIRAQNVQAATGQIGAPPSKSSQQFQYAVRAEGRLSSVKQFEQIIIRAHPDGSTVTVGDIARVNLGAQSYAVESLIGGQPTAMLAIYQASGANAIAVRDEVVREMERLSTRFPDDLDYAVLWDTTEVVKTTFDEVILTLFIALFLVVLVVYVFLQDWRATLIPAIAIPVSLIGAFPILVLFGFSANTISLFALILAIGIVVDDSIVVVENVQRLMSEEGLPPREATIKAMRQITGPVIATTLVLVAVFAPVGFLPGASGRLFSQFAVTISTAVVLSAVNALTLSPALCASLLRPAGTSPETRFFSRFNRGFDWLRNFYIRLVDYLLRRLRLGVGIFAAVVALTVLAFHLIPSGFIPPEDRGGLIVNIQLPDGASLERTRDIVSRVRAIVSGDESVRAIISAAGFSLLTGTASNTGFAFVILKPWDERTRADQHAFAVLERLRGQFAAINGANIVAFNPQAIPGLGDTGGLELNLLDRGGGSVQSLAAAMRGFIFEANGRSELTSVFSTWRADVPQVFIDLDREKARTLGVSAADVFQTLQNYLGSVYVNDFDLFGRNYRVILQADEDWRGEIRDIGRLHVRGEGGGMVPIATLAGTRVTLGPDYIKRYNQLRSVGVSAFTAPGVSTGEAIAALADVARNDLPEGYDIAWTGATLEEIAASGQTLLIFGLATLFAWLFLVAQYESWSIPVSIMLSVLVAIAGALAALLAVSIPLNIYVQIGIVILIGLAAKNAILIVEFSKVEREAGRSVHDAALSGARLRFRPVVMTAFAFILGVAPLLAATGAGAASRQSIGVTVFSGMVAATVAGIILVPVLYAIIQTMREKFAAVRRGRLSGARGS